MELENDRKRVHIERLADMPYKRFERDRFVTVDETPETEQRRKRPELQRWRKRSCRQKNVITNGNHLVTSADKHVSPDGTKGLEKRRTKTYPS